MANTLPELEAELHAARVRLSELETQYAQHTRPVNGSAPQPIDFRQIIDTSSNFTVIIDREYKVCYVNKRVSTLAPEIVLGANIFAVISPEFTDVARGAIDKVLAGAAEAEYETSVRLPSGELLWFESHVSPLQADEGVSQMILTTVDITARKNAEQTLRQSEQQYR